MVQFVETTFCSQKVMKWLSGWECLLLFQRTQVWLLALTTHIYNSRSRMLTDLFWLLWVPAYMWHTLCSHHSSRVTLNFRSSYDDGMGENRTAHAPEQITGSLIQVQRADFINVHFFFFTFLLWTKNDGFFCSKSFYRFDVRFNRFMVI